MKKTLSLLLLIVLAACSGSEVKGALGLKKKAPDEFMVMSRPALTVPPAFDLPEPQNQAVTPSTDATTDNAKKAIFGNGKAKKVEPTKGKAENLFLNKAGVAADQNNIRQILDEDLRATEDPVEDEPEEKGFFSRLFSPIELDETPDPIVSPAAEKERIKDAKAKGKKVDGEDAATTQPKGESVLNKIIGK